MKRLHLFLWSLLMSLVCIAAVIGYAMMFQDGLAKPHNEEALLLTSEQE